MRVWKVDELRLLGLVLALMSALTAVHSAAAQDPSSEPPVGNEQTEPAPAAATAPAAPSATIELNKLEAYDKGCRAYVVVNNPGEEDYQSFKLDLVIFQTDGVIGKRFALDLAPLRAKKKSVKLFEIEGTACDKIGSFLINDVMECKMASGPIDDCLQRLTTSTLSDVQLSK
jgi:hypothetical protein